MCLNQELNIYLRESEFPELKNYVGDDLLVTDGTSLLGADDKAAIAAIMNALEYLIAHPEIKHGPVKVGFVPDEEQGLRGAKAFDVAAFGADFGYTWTAAALESLSTRTGTRVMRKSSLPASPRTLCRPKVS